ncbi:uncharacterized protein [Heterodontus francisci]|uniref:uncharacterized protein n=1 Tax=Heterodontus francisci TaxID=7792 RepID=UPI00355BAC32
MTGAGKSSTINTFFSALDPDGRTVSIVPTGTHPDSFTPELRYFKSNSLKFWDPSGWNSQKDKANKVLRMILEGRVPPGTNLQYFNPDSAAAQYSVIPENEIHGVAFIFNINTIDNIHGNEMKEFQELQTIVGQKYIYRIVIGTHFDHLGISESYSQYIYEYKRLQEKFKKLSANTMMEKHIMFTISNEWKGDKIEETKCVLALYALENMVRNIDQYMKITQQ